MQYFIERLVCNSTLGALFLVGYTSNLPGIGLLTLFFIGLVAFPHQAFDNRFRSPTQEA